MPDRVIPLLEAEAADLLWAEEIGPATLALIEEARHTLRIGMFILAAAVDDDRGGRVRELLDAVVRAARRGVDVRVLVDAFEPEQDPYNVNLIAAHVLLDGGVPVRVYRDGYRSSLHSKVVVNERRALVGSGNWSAGGLLANVEAAVLVESEGVSGQLIAAMGWAWNDAEAMEPLP
ncbi:MAG: phospholipase D family protein [Dehalococcoidia bacterium]